MPGAPPPLERIAPWVAGVILALPVLVAHYPPMADLPAHEAVVGLLRHWGDPRFVPPNVYALNFGQPNQLLYFFILPLAHLMPIGTATKLVVAATLFLLPVAAAHFADHLGVTRWTALVVAPLGLGWMFFWGLLANLMGLAAYLFALPSLDRFVDGPTARRLGAATAWIVFLHFLHDFMALAAGVTLVVLTVCSWRGWRQGAVRVVPAALVAGLALVSRAFEQHQHLAQARGGGETVAFAPLLYRVQMLPGALFAGEGWQSGGLLAVASIPIVLFAIERRRIGPPARGGAESPESLASRAHRLRFEILAVVFVALYFVTPMAIGWTTQIHQRFLPIAWSLLAIAVAQRGDSALPAWRLPRLAASLLPIAPILMLWPEFALSDRAYRDLDAIIDHIEPGSSHVILELGPSNDKLFSPASCGGRVVARAGGRSLFDYTWSPASPVVERPDVQWTEVFDRIDPNAYRFVPAHDLRLFRYVILHTTDPGLGELARLAMEPEAKAVVHVGEFTLLESTLPRVPLDAHDDPFAGPHPPSLDERALATAKRLGGS
ncbi:MAG: hypothetical protein ACLQVI_36300 [Polyangiaceae bacterium]